MKSVQIKCNFRSFFREFKESGDAECIYKRLLDSFRRSFTKGVARHIETLYWNDYVNGRVNDNCELRKG